MTTDISERKRAENGIHDRVQTNVRIRVPEKPHRMLHGNAAENQRTTAYKAVHVVTVTDT
jgi:hypothetical protein